MNVHNTEIKAEEDERRVGQPTASELATPLEQRVSVTGLTAVICHWPIGDPRSPDFFFCGAIAVEGTPYCSHHCRVSYSPAPSRRR